MMRIDMDTLNINLDIKKDIISISMHINNIDIVIDIMNNNT